MRRTITILEVVEPSGFRRWDELPYVVGHTGTPLCVTPYLPRSFVEWCRKRVGKRVSYDVIPGTRDPHGAGLGSCATNWREEP